LKYSSVGNKEFNTLKRYIILSFGDTAALLNIRETKFSEKITKYAQLVQME
jgi:hypothetical protein